MNGPEQQPAQQRQSSTAGTFDHAPGGAGQWTEADVKSATPAQVRDALNRGLLATYLNSPNR